MPTRTGTADPVGTKYVEGFAHARSQVPTTTGMVKVGLRSGPIAQHSNIRERDTLPGWQGLDFAVWLRMDFTAIRNTYSTYSTTVPYRT